jgi:hypothetical protein
MILVVTLPPDYTTYMDVWLYTYAKSVFSMINFSFSSDNSVIFTVGWLAYGMFSVKIAWG